MGGLTIGLGDNIMASGMARGAHARGKRIAFGDGRTIKWDQNSGPIFQGNQNIAVPGSERLHKNLEWIAFYKGNRVYNTHDTENNRWVWNYEFKAKPGEIFFRPPEWAFGGQANGFIVIEPSVPAHKGSAPNKQWPVAWYSALTVKLINEGFRVLQLRHRGTTHTLAGARQINTPTFRHALALLGRSLFYIGPEGGLHHGAAALNKRGVVLFGGFVPPAVTGYDLHINLTGGAQEACGSLKPCHHCAKAMANISVEEVLAAALSILKAKEDEPQLHHASGA